MSRRRTEQSTPDSAHFDASARDRRLRRRQRSAPLIRRAMCEALEDRCLFTTVSVADGVQQFEYKDLDGNAVRVVVSGTVQAEFIFARVTKGANDSAAGWNQVILGDHVAAGSKEDGRDLFHIYVAAATIDSFISIATVPDVTVEGPRPMSPYSGSVSLTINPLRTNNLTRSTAGGTGEITIGTRTRTVPQVMNSGNRPIIRDNFSGHGIAPPELASSTGFLTAGLSTAPNVHLGRFLFGGTVMGRVSLQGSMETFYCGQLLTGIAEGQFSEVEPLSPGNFYVQGDIRNILVKGAIGGTGVASTRQGRAAPDYLTGTDFDIRGKVGQIKTGGDYQAFGRIFNTNEDLGLRTRQQEIEWRINPEVNRGSITDFQLGDFGDDEAFFNNDDFANPQFLGSINTKTIGNNAVHLNGQLQAIRDIDDISDYYAVALMAGQRVNVRLLASAPGGFVIIGGEIVEIPGRKLPLNLGVFDPDNRLVYSDYSNTIDLTKAAPETFDPDPNQQEWFSFVAEKPGIYRFAVAQTDDAPTFGTSGDRLGFLDYQLMIQGVGNMGLGGLVANETFHTSAFFVFNPEDPFGDVEFRSNMEVFIGDFGAIYSISDRIVSLGGLNAVAHSGNLRAIDAESIGDIEGTFSVEGEGYTRSSGANILVPKGSVGMIRSRTASGAITTINEDAPIFGLPNIGGDVQYIVAPNALITDLAVNGKIGVVQVAQFGDVFNPGSLSANADGVGTIGTIDLIHVTQGLGTQRSGGPLISAGPGGNIRYIYVTPGTNNVFRPRVYGGGFPEETNFVPGQNFNYTDDSGANVNITPTTEQFIDPISGGVVNLSGTLSVLSYPIAPSLTSPFGSGGGLAIIRVTSTRGMRITSDGITEIGDLVSTGTGPALVVNPFQPNGPDQIPNSGDEIFISDPNAFGANRENSITLRPSARRGLIDVWNTRGNNFNFIRNFTGGELVNAQIGATGEVLATNIGHARSAAVPGMLVEGSQTADLGGTSELEGTLFPFLETRNAFTINGGGETSAAVLDLKATQSIGNVMINGVAQRVAANADGVGTRGLFEGIVGAVYAKGQLRLVEIGEGVLPSGTGNFARAGVFVVSQNPGLVNQHSGRIGHLVGTAADIRGDIVSNTGIDRITLVDGSIINADIWVIGAEDTAIGTGADLAPTREFAGGGVIQGGTGDSGNIRNITVTSTGTMAPGGIIGTSFVAFNIGPILSQGGFGVFNSVWQTTGTGRISSVTSDGYGIRGGFFGGGQSVDSIEARGNGQKLATTLYSPSVRMSEHAPFDPFFGTKPGPMTDLHIVLGTTAATPIRKGNANASGSIDFTEIAVSRDVGPVKANTIKLSEFNVANLFTSLEVADYIDSIEMTTGRIPLLVVGNDAWKSRIEVAGDADTVSFGNFRGSNTFTSRGKIGVFKTRRSLYGNVYAQNGIQALRVGGSYGSQGTRTPQGLQELIVSGDVLSGSILTVEKNIARIDIKGNLQSGALIKAGTLGTVDIAGAEDGVIDVKPWS